MATLTASKAASLTKTVQGIKDSITKNASAINNASASQKASLSSGLSSASAGLTTYGKSSGSSSNKTPTAPTNVITPSTIAPTSPIKLPSPVMPTGTPDITSLNAALSNPTTGLKADSSGGFTVDQVTQDALTSSQDRFTKMMADLNNTKQPSAVDIQAKLDKQTGIDNLKQQEAQYTGQIDSIVKNSQAQSLALEGQGRGQTTQFLGGEQARIQREAAVAALPVQAQLAAVQGKIQVANDYINKWGALLIQDATNTYNNTVNKIKAVYDFGTAQDKLKFDNLAAQAKEKKDKETALATAKTKAISQALSQPGGSAVVAAIQAAGDENGVVTALGKFNGDVLGNQLKQSQLYTSSLQQQKLLQELSPDDTGKQGDIQAYAQQYASTGVLPSPSALKESGISVSQVTEFAKQMPKSNGSLLSSSTGAKPQSLSPTQEDGISSLYDLTKKLDLAKQRFSELNTGLLPGLAKTVYYTKSQQQYDDLKSEIVDLLARARSGAALTADEVANYEQKLPGRFNDSLFLGKNGATSIQDLNDSIQQKLKTNLNTNNLVIQGYSKVNIPSLGEHIVGDIVNIGGTQYRVLPDGTLTDVIQ